MSREEECPPAVVAGTSTQLSGGIPQRWRDRLVVFILGPRGVGKNLVARAVVGATPVILKTERIHAAATEAVRRRKWAAEYLEAPNLLIDGPSLLDIRPGPLRLLKQLIAARREAGLLTVVLEGSDGTAMELADAVEPQHRVTVNLRFPAAAGRDRFLKKVCAEIELPVELARQVKIEEPWTYLKVTRALRKLKRSLQGEDTNDDFTQL